ncbi:hypothetical protein KR044_002467 [Drosophila immigrans]|nr:hypothetical protein KR044_002467 [Drosophila immigrans]
MELVKCDTISQDLIKRICNSLQIATPPVGCLLVLPISMAVKSKTKSSTGNVSRKSTDVETTSVENNIASPSKTESKKESVKEAPPPLVPQQCRATTRNCGCNTMITGKFDESSDSSEPSSANKDKEKDKDKGKGKGKDKDKVKDQEKGNDISGGACCSSGGCYYCPCYKYCYNPCTGCFYWRKQCCCCNGCCGNGGGGGTGGVGNSCPIQKPALKPDPKSTTSTTSKNKSASSKTKLSKRSTAGALLSIQPGAQEMHNQWMGFPQQSSMTAPPFFYRSSRFFPPQYPMNSRRSHNH